MQTFFSEKQLKNKDNKSSEKIFRKCVHCGFAMLHAQPINFWEMN